MATGIVTKAERAESSIKTASVEQPENAEVAKALVNFDMDKTMNFFVGLMSMLGDLSVKIGELEEKNRDVPEVLKLITNDPKTFLNMLLEKSTGDEVRTLILALLKLDELSPKLANLFSLPPEEKIKIGKELQNISSEIEKAYAQSKKERGSK
jgi:archaellum component FlaC